MPDTTADGFGYAWEIETPWIKLNELQGRGRVRRLLVAGQYRGRHDIRYRVARDYGEADFLLDTASFTLPVTTLPSSDPWTALIEGDDRCELGIVMYFATGAAGVEVRDDQQPLSAVTWSTAVGVIGVVEAQEVPAIAREEA